MIVLVEVCVTVCVGVTVSVPATGFSTVIEVIWTMVEVRVSETLVVRLLVAVTAMLEVIVFVTLLLAVIVVEMVGVGRLRQEHALEMAFEARLLRTDGSEAALLVVVAAIALAAASLFPTGRRACSGLGVFVGIPNMVTMPSSAATSRFF